MRWFETRREYLFILVLILVPVCSYLNSLDGEFVFDDKRIYESQYVKLETFSIPGLVHAVQGMEPASRPVANLTFVLNYLVHGFAVRGYHLVNLAVHVSAGILLYFFLKTTLALPVLRDRHRFAEGIPFFSALLWLVHPLQTQAVSYIVQRMTSLSALFFVLSLLLYARGRMAGSADRRVLLFGGSILSGVLAMGSKEIAVTLPLFILLYEWFFVQDLRTDWLARNKKYLIGVGIFLVVICFLFLGNKPWSALASGYAVRDFSLTERVLTEFRVVLFYLGLLAFPHPGHLSLEHEFELSTSLFSPMTTLPAIAALFFLLVLAVVMAPKCRFASFSILWFLGNHLVEGSVLPLELVFEHRNYLPSMMVIPLVVTLGGRFISKRLLVSILLGVAALFSYWTYQRNFAWQDRISLWRDTAEKGPSLIRPVNALGQAYMQAGRIIDAEEAFRRGLTIDPDNIIALANLYILFSTVSRPDEAEPYLFRLKGIVSQENFHCKKNRRAVEDLTVFLGKQGRCTDVIFFLESIEECLFKNLPGYYDALAICYARLGEYDKSAVHFSKALSLDPDNPYYLFGLARAYFMAGDTKKALQVYQKLLYVEIPDEIKSPFEQMRQLLSPSQSQHSVPDS